MTKEYVCVYTSMYSLIHAHTLKQTRLLKKPKDGQQKGRQVILLFFSFCPRRNKCFCSNNLRAVCFQSLAASYHSLRNALETGKKIQQEIVERLKEVE